MASEGKARTNKQMTITFTLPISCQICLGKVKQPVLCPNLHVFCSLCLEIWLKRNSQCPACRVDIGPENPVKHIIGGHIEDDDSGKKSSPNIRRARFDLLYQEYEDHLEQMKKENIILRTENNILIAQLKDAEDANENHTKEKDRKSTMSASTAHTSDGPSLLMLTKSLQEAQKLYLGIKADMSGFKQENAKLKDENIQLTRENENLRLELAQRSPKKFGRYTVATLETKISEQEREIRQLKKALECSDLYIEELQRKCKTPLDNNEGKIHDVETGPAGKPRFKISLEPNHSAVNKNSFNNDSVVPADGPRKVLFGKVFDDDATKANQKIDDFFADAGYKSLHMQHSAEAFSRNHMGKAENNAKLNCQATHSDGKHMPQISSHSLHQHPESIMKSAGVSRSDHHSREDDSGNLQEHASKKVHFNMQGKSSDASSFDLEMPSPASSLVSDSHSSISKEVLLSLHKSSTKACLPNNYRTHNKVDNIPFSESDGNMNSMTKNTVSQTSATSMKASKALGKTKQKKTPTVAKKAKQLFHDANDSSHLSYPDNLNDTNDLSEHSDLDISMTPELTDCLQLMNQAEKKISLPDPWSSGSSEPIFPAASATSTSSVTDPVDKIALLSSFPSTSISFQEPLFQNLPVYTSNYSQGFMPSGNSISGWEQQFYNALKVNPYKFTSVNDPHDFTGSYKSNPLNKDHYKTGGQHVYSSVDLNPTKGSVEKDFKFSDPIKVSLPISGRLTSTVKFSDINHIMDKDVFKPNLYLSFPSSSATNTSFPTSSSAYNFTASTSTAPTGSCYQSSSLASADLSSLSELNSSETQTGKHATNLSSSVLEFPRKLSQHSKEHDNALSLSLSNSGLEWPEDNLDRDHEDI